MGFYSFGLILIFRRPNPYMKSILLVLIATLSSFFTHAQDFPFGKPSQEDVNLKKYSNDTSANAVVLKEYGTAYLNNDDGNLVFEYHVRIKLFNSKGFKKGDIQIPIRKTDANTFEKITEIKALTFYPNDNGTMQTGTLDPKQIFTEKKAGRYHDLVKFAMPNLKDNCIIEYSYRLNSPFIFNFKTWEFQSDIPKIYSEYNPLIPAVYNYNVTLRGPLQLTKTSAKLEKECFQPGGGFKADCSKMTYIMTNIPAFVEEEYMTASSNFMSAMYFELSDYSDYNGGKHQVTKNWKDVDHELKTHPSFGIQLKKKDFFKDKLSSVVQGKTTEIDRAKSIYSYIQKHYKWDSSYGKYCDDGLKKAFENHTGNAGDINMSLIVALTGEGLKAEPIILSTRDNGTVNTLFPILSDFNYVICKVDIDNKSYFLDATDPLLPFGLLPVRCFNDKGRLMSFDKESSWIDLKASQKESQSVNLSLSVSESGKTTGTLKIYSMGYEAYNKRKAIKKFNSIEEYVESVDERFPRIKILKHQIENLDSLESNLAETYDIEITSSGNQINISPYFLSKITSNPFKLTERTYPVDLGAPSDTKIGMQIIFPPAYELVSQPKPLAIALPDNGGKTISQVTNNDNTITFFHNMSLNKSIYSPNEYHYLKAFFDKLIESQQSDLIFKKKI